MVSKRRGFLLGSACCGLALACDTAGSEPPGLVLSGFRLVDVESERVEERDLVIEAGKLSTLSADVALARGYPRVAGEGRFLVPALWDFKASIWGNLSALSFEDVTQPLGITDALRIQLYYGVGHVVATAMEREWMVRELKRATALELAAAEVIYPDLALCGEGGAPFACFCPKPGEVAALVADLAHKGVNLLQIYYVDADVKPTPGVTLPVLEQALAAAAQHGMHSYVFVSTWAQAEEAVKRGAGAIHGLPRGELSAELVELMKSHGTAYAPALTGALELARLLGNYGALHHTFLTSSVPIYVLDTFRNPNGVWEGWRGLLAEAKHEKQALADVARLAAAGVPLISATDAGWSAGAFQGYSTHTLQAWLERAGLGVWQRLRAATVAPARYMGRHVGFAPGDAADFIALSADPLGSVAALREIDVLVRDGRIVERDTLAPDVSRAPFKP